MGRIAAGTPIEAIQHDLANVAVPASMLSSAGRHYALEVKGDSMIEAGINSTATSWSSRNSRPPRTARSSWR